MRTAHPAHVVEVFLHGSDLLLKQLTHREESSIGENLIGDQSEQDVAEENEAEKVSLLDNPIPRVVRKGLVIAIADRADRRRHQVDRLKVNREDVGVDEANGGLPCLLLHFADHDPSTGEVVDTDDELEGGKHPVQKVVEQVGLQVEDAREMIDEAPQCLGDLLGVQDS